MKNKNTLIIFLGVLALVLVLVVGSTVLKDEDKSEQDVNSESAEESTEVDRTDIVTIDGNKYKLNTDLEIVLFMGIDKDVKTEIDDITGLNGQSDSLNLLVLDKVTKTGQIMQINRDSIVDLELYTSSGERLGYKRGQICLQYAYGNTDGQSCKLVMEKVSELLFNVDIKKYVSLTMDGIVCAADSLGGVSITIPEDYTHIDSSFVEGDTILLKGELAESFVRYRDISELDSNIDRMKRQAYFMEALIAQLQNANDMQRYLDIYEDLEPYMETNLTADEMKAFSEYKISKDTIELPGNIVEKEGYAEYIVDGEKVQEIVLKTFYKPY